jgi:hypothetical protein
MHQILEDLAEILFLSLLKDSTTMPTGVEHILPNAAGSPPQLWFSNVKSVLVALH